MRIFGFGVFGMFSLFSVKRWVRVEREWPAVMNVVQLRCLRRWEGKLLVDCCQRGREGRGEGTGMPVAWKGPGVSEDR